MSDSSHHNARSHPVGQSSSESGSSCISTSIDLPESGWSQQIPTRLRSQLEFLVAVDALKQINRASRISDGSRNENSAEHSWHLTLFAQILAEYANEPVDIDKVVRMLMVHDIVEIDAGDVPLHAPQRHDQSDKEKAAAARLFGLLPDDQAQTLQRYWEEFEQAQSAEAKFAKAVDRLQPILLNMLNKGGTWTEFDVSLEQAITRTSGVERGSNTLWTCCNAMFDEAVRCGWLKTDQPADWS